MADEQAARLAPGQKLDFQVCGRMGLSVCGTASARAGSELPASTLKSTPRVALTSNR
jgi:hypothetical protein